MSEFMRLRLGPVVMKDEVEYFKEFHLLDEIRAQLSLAGLSDDGSRMILRNDFYRKDILAARVTSTAGWLDLAQRKLTCPPPELLKLMQTMTRSADFRVLSGSVR